MKACLMRVNYDPRYVTPNHANLQSRLAVTRDIYGAGTSYDQRRLKESLEEAAARRKAKQLLASLGGKTPDKDLRDVDRLRSKSKTPKKEGWCENEIIKRRPREEGRDHHGDRDPRKRLEQHKEGVAAAHCSLRPLHQRHGNLSASPVVSGSDKGPFSRTPTLPSIHTNGSYGDRLLKRQQSVNTFSSPGRIRLPKENTRLGVSHETGLHLYQRSKTMATFGDLMPKKNSALAELERRARREAERAIKDRKIFTIMGPYHSLRVALRRRGWVEKFNNILPPPEAISKRKTTSDSDDDDMDRHNSKENFIPPWEEENGFYAIMSHITRNCTPSLIFALKTIDVECRRGGQLVNHFGKSRHFTTKSDAVQNVRPTLIFAVRSLDVESRSRHQIVNHYAKANHFTTKMGLCQNLRAVPWYEQADPDDFYPRCFKLDDDEERMAFIEDYHFTACFGFLKWFVEKYDGVTVGDEDRKVESTITQLMSTTQALGNDAVVESVTDGCPCSQSNQATSTPQTEDTIDQQKQPCSQKSSAAQEKSQTLAPSSARHATRKHEHVAKVLHEHVAKVLPVATVTLPSMVTTGGATSSTSTSPSSSPSGCVMGRFLYHKSGTPIKMKYYHMAVKQCEVFLRIKDHEDIDIVDDPEELSDTQWELFLQWYYTFIHEDGDFPKVTGAMVRNCQELLERVKAHWPQYMLDGYRNIWIIKPGAKSRGRGIVCMDRLDKILQMVTDTEDKLVAQKYIERPFLVHNTKFDIRQWFLITDWQPLTIWFYKSCYARFCSQQFTLDSFHEAIHLSNNSVQKHYANNSTRSDCLPDDNMWTDDEFQDFLRAEGNGDMWHSSIIPGMKKALVCAMLCTQELVEVRKSAFELYGADFMLTEDLQPWLIEINSSPSMARNTRATCKLVDLVLEDMLRVVLDRRTDKNADTGGFEMIFKQNHVGDPRPLDNDLAITGRKIRKRHFNYTPHTGPVRR